jgi:hypothetical protein
MAMVPTLEECDRAATILAGLLPEGVSA